jgi:hypothetical protein
VLEKIEMLVMVVPAAAIAKCPGQLANTVVEVTEIVTAIKVSPITLASEVSFRQAIAVTFRFLPFTPMM